MAPRENSALLLVLLCAGAARGECDNATVLSLQIDGLLAVYDRETPPAAKLLVNVSIDIRHATVNEIDSSVRMLADLKLSWVDQRLSWNESEWGCDAVMISAERVWAPDVVVLNAAATSAGDSSLRARLGSQGSLAWIKRLDITAPVQLHLYDWPRDVQTVTFKFGSRMYNMHELDLAISDLKHALVFESGAWEMVSMSGATSVWSREGVESRVAAWTLQVRRRAPAHALATTAVLVAVLLQLAAASALPPPQRPPLAAAAALVAAVWLVWWGSRGGGGVEASRAAGAVCAACVLAAALGVAAALVQRVAQSTAAPPPPLRTLLSSVSGICDLTPHPDSVASEKSVAWAATARLLDRALLAAFHLTGLIIAAVYFL